MRLVGLPVASILELERPLKVDIPKGYSLFSIGGEKETLLTCELLRQSQIYIQDNSKRNFITDNDGLFTADEIELPSSEGDHLLTFHADHADLIGLCRSKTSAIFKFIVDHLLHISKKSS
eukprot:TRINITY_DN1843_c0_g1_i3.p1 TRINITY_DN1843_c0_g1~~TRINITY_DN1843_c0_g1_i3.p1  ORF type:complete len:120 (-),score=12.15 TRINITY_DN1843_c0_g1_i3:124-483(-)